LAAHERVLITGATGFAGSYLAEECTRRGWEVHGTTRQGEGARNLLDAPSVIVHPVELSDGAGVRRLIAEVAPTAVYHLAAQASVQQAWHDPVATLTNNSVAQFHILSAVQEVCPQARVLVVSTAEVYGRIDRPEQPVAEETPLGPLDPYSVSKVTQEMLGVQYARAFDLPVVRVRPFNHAGPRQRPGFVGADFARQIALIEAEQIAPVIKVGNLSAVRDMSDVRDIVRAYVLALAEGEPGAVYNIASGHGISMEELLQAFLAEARVVITVEVDPARLRPSDRPRIVGDATRLRVRTGWSPSIPLTQTIRDTLDYWRAGVGSTR
jgi:GDP-4-dehydro-6-deoxy-D-mannose reductase